MTATHTEISVPGGESVVVAVITPAKMTAFTFAPLDLLLPPAIISRMSRFRALVGVRWAAQRAVPGHLRASRSQLSSSGRIC